MKKSLIAALLLICFLMIFCAACGGGSGDDAQVSAPAEATELPTITPPPAGAGNGQDVIAAEDNAAAGIDGIGEVTYVSAEHEIAAGMLGAEVSELFAAIGQPNSSEYTASCLVDDGEDGLLYYDGFTVSTTRFANGTETVMGIY